MQYRQQESQRVEDSASLAETFVDLKSLTLDLAYFSRGSFTRDSEIKYTVNLAKAKSRFRISCPNDQCVGGDFDLSAEIAEAVAAHRTSVSGEAICQGWSSQTTIDQVHCHRILRYKLSVEYEQPSTLNETGRTEAEED